MLGEKSLKRRREIEVREPEPRGGIRGDDPRSRGRRENEVLSDLDSSERLISAAYLDDPAAVRIVAWCRSGEPELELGSVGAHRRYCSGKRG